MYSELRMCTRTILLASPTTRLQAIVAQVEGPLRILAVSTSQGPAESSCTRADDETVTYTVPWSVVGGASTLGFCSSRGTFCALRTFEPYGPR